MSEGTKHRRPVMSGPDSEAMWAAINAVDSRAARDALYLMGCRCQELESRLEGALARVAALEAGAGARGPDARETGGGA